MKESGTITVRAVDLMTAPTWAARIGQDQWVLHRLKDEGAPVRGTIWLRLTPGYTFTRWNEPFESDIHISWRPTQSKDQ